MSFRVLFHALCVLCKLLLPLPSCFLLFPHLRICLGLGWLRGWRKSGIQVVGNGRDWICLELRVR